MQSVLQALASPTRREILWLIWDHEHAAGEIATTLGLSAPTISAHLATLRTAGLVTMRIDGAFRRYRADQERLRSLPSLVPDAHVKWTPADDLPEVDLAHAQRLGVVAASVVLPCDRSTAYRGFTDGERFGRWLGVPVTLDDGRFACTLEWGTRVRGTYDAAVADDLIVMRWDFQDDVVPVPGAELTAYVRFYDDPVGSRVEVHQLVEDETQAAFMEVAWSLVLGRLREGIVAASGDGGSARTRPERPKLRGVDGR